MGSDRMSGDESNTRDGLKYYVIFPDEWQNPEVAPWIKVFGQDFIFTKFDQVNRSKQGNWPWIRIPTTQYNVRWTDKSVPGLPCNFYNEAQLNTLDENKLETLNVQQFISLVHSEEVLQWAFLSI